MKKPTEERIAKFKEDWGQTHDEICSNLEYDVNDADDLLKVDFFWNEESKLWLNKNASGFEGDDQMVADYLKHL